MRADVAKALLREAESCAADRRVKNRAAGDELDPTAEGPTLARSRDGSVEASATELQPKQADSPLLPWRDATVGRYRRIF